MMTLLVLVTKLFSISPVLLLTIDWLTNCIEDGIDGRTWYWAVYCVACGNPLTDTGPINIYCDWWTICVNDGSIIDRCIQWYYSISSILTLNIIHILLLILSIVASIIVNDDVRGQLSWCYFEMMMIILKVTLVLFLLAWWLVFIDGDKLSAIVKWRPTIPASRVFRMTCIDQQWFSSDLILWRIVLTNTIYYTGIWWFIGPSGR